MAGGLIRGQHSRSSSTCCLLAVAVLLVAAQVAAQEAQAQIPLNEDVHVVFLTDCTRYSDWQTLGMVFSWRESGQVSM
jgi:hypothetical protein